ncbi:MAG: hypothetical protein ACKO9F_05190, partial [Caldilinea sp.]
AQERGLALPSIAEARYEIGYGIKVNLEERMVWVGSERFLQMEQIEVPAAVNELRSAAHALGHSLVLIAVDGQVAGAIELAPTLRPEARRIIEMLRSNYVASMAPGVVVIGGVFLLHFGVVSSIMLYNVGLLAGVTNSMLPLLQRKPAKASPIVDETE